MILLNPSRFASAFVPTNLAGLRLWLDGSDASTLFDATSGGSLVAADGQVARWEDKSGSARHFTQGTSANRPLRKTAVVNGRAVLRFDGVNDTLTAATDIASSLSGGSLFVVRKYITVPTSNKALFYINSTGTVGNTLLAVGTTTSLKPYLSGRRLDGDTTQSVIAAGTATTGAELQTAIVSWAGTSLNLYINGTLDGTSSSFQTAGSTAAGTATVVAVGSTAATGGYTNGDIAEILFYGSALSGTDRGTVEAYLKAKWGTP